MASQRGKLFRKYLSFKSPPCFFFFLLASLWRRFSRCLNPVVNVRRLVLISVTPPYAFLTMLCHWKSLKEYVVLFALTFVSAFKHASYFSDLRISWDLFFFFFVCFISVLGFESSLLPHSERVFEVSVLSTNASYLPSSEWRRRTVCFLTVQINHYNRSYLGYCSFLQIQYSLAFGSFALHFNSP